MKKLLIFIFLFLFILFVAKNKVDADTSNNYITLGSNVAILNDGSYVYQNSSIVRQGCSTVANSDSCFEGQDDENTLYAFNGKGTEIFNNLVTNYIYAVSIRFNYSFKCECTKCIVIVWR